MEKDINIKELSVMLGIPPTTDLGNIKVSIVGKVETNQEAEKSETTRLEKIYKLPLDLDNIQ